MKYRPEIDGLRAVAVVPVVLFHAGFRSFSGGFVGVDVFFVISGYLITTILLTEMEDHRFSLVRFYERRARRILPALYLVMVACIPFAWAWMSPDQFKGFAHSIAAVALFASNVLFWRESGYFDLASEEKPLLHTWSLSVEEQFYLLFPLLLLLIMRYARRHLPLALAVLIIASLILSELGQRHFPSANFFLIPSRAWELGAGCFCAMILRRRRLSGNSLLSMVGMALIFVSVVWFDDHVPFPSVYALMPVAGTVLIILFAAPGTGVARLLSLRPIVGIGLISYSAYLWHQPLMAFARIRSISHPDPSLMFALAVLSFGLAYLSWKYVEIPIRRRQFAPLSRPGQVFAVAALAGTIAVFAGLFALKQSGPLITWTQPELFSRTQPAVGAFTPCKGFEEIAVGQARCRRYGDGGNAIVIWGDSHARVFDKVARPYPGVSLYVLSHPGCPPAIGVRRTDRASDKTGTARNCELGGEIHRYARFIADLAPHRVYMTARWTLYTNGWHRRGLAQSSTHLLAATTGAAVAEEAMPTDTRSSTAALINGLHRSIDLLSPEGEVVLMTQPPDLYLLSDYARLRWHDIARGDVAHWHRGEAAVMSKVSAEKSVQVFDTKSLFCTEARCLLRRDGRLIYSDDNHLSPLAAAELMSALLSNTPQVALPANL